MDIKEKTIKWVNELNAIPMGLIKKAYPNMEDIEILSTEKECINCSNSEFKKNDDDSLTCTNCDYDEGQYERYELPMWGTVWYFNSGITDEWVKDNLEVVNGCGFWIYETDDIGVFIGINGAGYDFYENHWIPLYKAMYER